MRKDRWNHAAAARGAAAALALLAGCATPPPDAQEEDAYVWRTLAGAPGGLGNVDGAGAAARFCQPCGVAFTPAGHIAVADYYNYALRLIAPDGGVTTLAGRVGEAGAADGVGNAARFDRPAAVAADAAGNLYVADSGNHLIRKVTPEGAVATLAGAAGQAGAVDGAGAAARFRAPLGVAADAAGNVYVADTSNHTIRKVTPAGAVSTLAGQAALKDGVAVGGFADGKGAAARFRGPRGVAVDAAGNVYVADTENAVVRRVAPDGTVRTLAGAPGAAGYADGTNAAARFSYPQAVAVDGAGNVYVADTGNRVIRRVTPAGLVTTVTNGQARFAAARGLAADKAGNLAVADNDAQTVSLVAARGGVRVAAGSASRHGAADGPAEAARFNRPHGLARLPGGGLALSDSFNHTLRAVAPDGTVTTLAGRAGSSGYTNAAAEAARFSWPAGAAADAAGNLYVADSGNHLIRKLAPGGAVTTLAGAAGQAGAADGAAAAARFYGPADVACDAAGNLYVADRGNHAIRKVTPAGAVSTVAGALGKAGRADGRGGAARFNGPCGVALDALGNLFVADTGNHVIRAVTPAGEVSTVAGCAGLRGAEDGRGAVARFNGPAALAAGADGALLVADRDNHLLRRVAPDGTVTTVGGRPNAMDAADGLGRAARFAQPSGVALAADGRVFVADACNNRIVAGEPVRVGLTVRAASGGAPRAPAPAAEPPGRELPYAWEVLAGLPGEPGLADGRGAAARFGGPQGLALEASGALVVADSRYGVLRRVTPDGEVSTLPARAAFEGLIGVAAGRAGALAVTDGAHQLWSVAPSGEIRLLAGAAHRRGAADGAGPAARFDCATGVAADETGNVLVADYNNHTLRRVAPSGEVTTLAGRVGHIGHADGAGGHARLTHPCAVAAERGGGAVVAAGDRVRRVAPSGEVSTLAPGFAFGRLDGVAADGAGYVYAADRGRGVIWRISPSGEVRKLGGSERVMAGSGWLVTGLAADRAGVVYVADPVRACVLRGRPQ